MIYDWDGRRTRRVQWMRLATAVTLGLVVPVAITVWPYIR
jgi:hypothetical protein